MEEVLEASEFEQQPFSGQQPGVGRAAEPGGEQRPLQSGRS